MANRFWMVNHSEMNFTSVRTGTCPHCSSVKEIPVLFHSTMQLLHEFIPLHTAQKPEIPHQMCLHCYKVRRTQNLGSILHTYEERERLAKGKVVICTQNCYSSFCEGRSIADEYGTSVANARIHRNRLQSFYGTSEPQEKEKKKKKTTHFLHLGKIIFVQLKILLKQYTESKSPDSKRSLKISIIQILKLFNLNFWKLTIIASFISGIALQLLNSLASKSRLIEMLYCLIWHYSQTLADDQIEGTEEQEKP